MNLGLIDVIILLIILLGGVIGFKEGVIKKLTSVVGLVLVVILSFTKKTIYQSSSMKTYHSLTYGEYSKESKF